jgi:hypothetical protein
MTSLVYSHAVIGVLTVLDLGVLALLVDALRDMVVIASCKQQHKFFDCCVGVVLVLPSPLLLLSLLLAIRHKGIIVALLMFASWCCNQSYCWRFAPLQSLMWLIHIDEKGWLSQA